MEDEQAEELANTLATGTWTHDYPVTVEGAKDFGMPISTEMPEEVYELMELCPRTSQRRPSVQYVPALRGDGEESTASDRG